MAATPIASGGVTEAAVRVDIQAVMLTFLAANNPPATGVWVMAPKTALALNLITNALGQHEICRASPCRAAMFFGMPVIVSDYVPTSAARPTRNMFV